MKHRIIEWLVNQTEWFNYDQLDDELNIKTAKEKTLRRVVIFDMVKTGILCKHDYRRKTYRNTNLKKIRLV